MESIGESLREIFLGCFSRIKNRHSYNKGSEQKGRYWQISSSFEEDYCLLDGSPPAKARTGVYWGRLKDGTQIAVKRLNGEIMKDIEDFNREVQALAQIQHKNVLTLRGYCAEGQERMIVYNFMPNSSLFSHLHGEAKNVLSWDQRTAIAFGCAEGLGYLHVKANCIHGNIKSTNVLLDSEYGPLLVDIGMPRLLRKGEKLYGAFGYAAPEIFNADSDFSQKSDVFSFGILLLELVSGRDPAEKIEGDEGKLTILEWAQSLVISGKVKEVVDPALQGQYNEEGLEKIVNAALLCSQDQPENRASIADIILFLKNGDE